MCSPDELPPVLSVKQAAALMGVSGQTIRSLFENEPGTLIFAKPETLHKRPYRLIKIPRPVFERVRNRLSVGRG